MKRREVNLMESGETKPSDTEKTDFDRYIQIWSKAVDTQMHFNEMCVRSRQLGLAFATAALGLGIVFLSQKDGFSFEIPFSDKNILIHITFFLVLGAALAVLAVRQLDLHVYHKMLRGAVAFNEDFEERYMKKIFSLEKGMTQAISYFGRTKHAVYRTELGYTTSDKNKKSYNTTSGDNLWWFYTIAIAALVLIAFCIFIFTNISVGETGDWMFGKPANSTEGRG